MKEPEHDTRRPAALADFDQIAAAAMDDPHTMLHQLRAACPMGRSERYGGQWAIVSHAGVTAAARDADTFRSGSPGPGFPVFATSMPMIGSGFGAHRCLGANLARVELQVLIQEVLRRLPDYEVVPAEVVRYPGLNRGMSGLGARFTPGSPEDAER